MHALMARAALLALAALVLTAGPASARVGALAAWAGGASSLPMALPADAQARAAVARGATWLLGVRPTARAGALARAHGARRVADGAYVVPAGRARAAAAALARAGLLTYAEPDRRFRRSSVPDATPDAWARGAVVPAAQPGPPPGRVSIGILDDAVDAGHPDLAGHTLLLNGTGDGEHGTMVASAAAGSAGNGGVTGVLPGAPLVGYRLPAQITCSAAARGVDALIEAKVAVINLSFGAASPCATLYRVVEQAIGAGIIVVAAAGNEFERGNPVVYPAAHPHVLSVAAIGTDLSSSYFSSANAAVDVSAPGEQVPLALPVALDVTDGAQDGVTLADGTSFAAPIVAGAAAWVRAARPSLTGLQVADALRRSARDLDERGWDADTGWGLISLPAALRVPAPRADPGEPNDDIPQVDGAWFADPDRPLFRGSGSRSLRATVDRAEDPADVYRVRMPPRSSLRVALVPAYGDPDLFAFDGSSRSLRAARLVASSVRARGTDRFTLTNRSRRTRTGYLAVGASETDGTIDAGYRLTVSRARFRR
jgi:subtilisin family serine protease